MNELENKIAKSFDDEFVSPYRLIKVLNEVAELNLPTQMGYNYVKNNLVPTTLNSTGKKQIARADAISWMVRYIEKKANQSVEAELETAS